MNSSCISLFQLLSNSWSVVANFSILMTGLYLIRHYSFCGLSQATVHIPTFDINIYNFFFLKNSFITLPFLIFSYLLLHLILLLSFSVLPPFFLNHGQYACLPTLISQLPVHLPVGFTVTVLLFHSATCSLSLISCLTYTGKMKIIFHLFQKGF